MRKNMASITNKMNDENASTALYELIKWCFAWVSGAVATMFTATQIISAWSKNQAAKRMAEMESAASNVIDEKMAPVIDRLSHNVDKLSDSVDKLKTEMGELKNKIQS